MNRIISILIALLPWVAAYAGEPYFCTKAGSVLYYERYDASRPDKLVRTTTMEILSARKDASGDCIVAYAVTLRKANGKEMYGGRADVTLRIGADHTMYIDSGQSMKVVVSNMMPRSTVTSSGSVAVLPAVLAPGDKLPESHSVVEVSGFSCSVDVTEREVLRTETVTVPAGTFDTVVVREHKVEKMPLYTRDTWSDSWYVASLGYVRHDTYNKKKELETSEVLVRR